MPANTNRQWVLARRPAGQLGADDMRWVEARIPEPVDGTFLVRNLYLSCDPTQRNWLEVNMYLPAVRIGEVIRSFAVGQVVTSRDSRFAPGQLVQGLFGWQDYALVHADADSALIPVPSGTTIETAMSILGYTGIAAYFGMLDIARPTAGETVLVSSAAGATGSAAGQIAKILGCRVVGIAGGSAKRRYLVDELRFDAAIDYKSETLLPRLREVCPDRIDVYFDNVGERILEAALLHLALRGRVVLCGGMATYDDPVAAGPRTYLNLILQRGWMQGFLVLDYRAPRRPSRCSRAGSVRGSSGIASTSCKGSRTLRPRWPGSSLERTSGNSCSTLPIPAPLDVPCLASRHLLGTFACDSSPRRRLPDQCSRKSSGLPNSGRGSCEIRSHARARSQVPRSAGSREWKAPGRGEHRSALLLGVGHVALSEPGDPFRGDVATKDPVRRGRDRRSRRHRDREPRRRVLPSGQGRATVEAPTCGAR